MTDRTILIDGKDSLYGLRLSTGLHIHPEDLCWMHVRYRRDRSSQGRVLCAAVVDMHYEAPGNWKVVASQQLKWFNTMLDHNRPAIFRQIIDYIREIDRMDEGEIYSVKVFSLMPENFPAVLRFMTLQDDETWTDLKHPI